MGREVRRVPRDFDWPLNKVWEGFLSPDSLDETPCVDCDGTGYSPTARRLQNEWYGYVPFDPASTGSTPNTADTPAVRALAERNVSRAPEYYGRGEWAIRGEAERLARDCFNSWSHHLSQEDVDALIADNRLWDFMRRLVDGKWQQIDPPPAVTAAEVNAWSIGGMGHDSLNCWVVIRARCKRMGEPELCASCEGHGSHEVYPGQRDEAEAWEPTPPPEGDGWQYWETVSEGSPISPVFPTAEALSHWLQTEYSWGADHGPLTKEQADNMVKVGWAPSLIADSTGLHSGDEVVNADWATT